MNSPRNHESKPASTRLDSTRGRPPFGVFVATTIVVFFLTLSAADSVGMVPDYIDGSTSLNTNSSTTDATAASNDLALNALPELGDQSPSYTGADVTVSSTAYPKRIVIPAIGMDLPVQNPSTRDIGILDALLQNGPARYVDSAKLGAAGNVILFAHSSHLPVVHNQMFKAFNRIPELSAGDTITIKGDDGKSYLYSVVSVRKANADEAVIPLTTDSKKLTLVTCDTLTSKSARFILEANFVGVIN